MPILRGRHRLFPFLSLILLARPSAGAEPFTLGETLAQVEERNPEILAARRRWEASSARTAGAAAWPDPVLGLSREKTPAGDRMTHLRAEQMIPFPGKLSTESRMKLHEARIAESDYKAAALRARAEARALYYGLFRADGRAARLAESVEVMKSMSRIAASRTASAGGGSEPFAILAELARMENMLLEERRGRELLTIQLNALLDRDVQTPVGPTDVPAPVAVPRDLKELTAAAEANDPLYLASLHEENHARSMRRRARLGFAPDIGLMGDRQIAAGGARGYEAGVSLTVPLWLSRPYAGMKEARAHVAEAEAAARGMRNEVVKMVAMEFTETGTHLALARNIGASVVPASESAFRLERRRYESGQGDSLRLLEAARALLRAHMDYYDELYHYGEHWGLLERWVGVPLDRGESDLKDPQGERR